MAKLAEDIFIIDCCRTPIGGAHKGLKELSAAQLAAVTIKELLRRQAISGELISEVILGNVVSAGTGQNLAREAVSLSGLPLSIPAFVVNNVCGSGNQAFIAGVQKILAEGEVFVIVGAAESASHCPLLDFEDGGNASPSLVRDGLTCPISHEHMGLICEALAARQKITREQQDRYAVESHRRACCARADKSFAAEIVPVMTSQGVFQDDERPRANAGLDKLSRLPPAFLQEGTVTAGNASAPADGACAFLLGSRQAVAQHGLHPLAKVVAYSSVGVAPEQVFEAGILAVERCLGQCGLTVKDIDLFEVTEAFAAQSIFVCQALGLPAEKVNIYGGDVALGHPLSIAGARALVTLSHLLRARKKKRGLAYVSFGAGGAIAIIIENQ